MRRPAIRPAPTDSIRDTKPTSWSSPSSGELARHLEAGGVGSGAGEPGQRAERLAGGGDQVGRGRRPAASSTAGSSRSVACSSRSSSAAQVGTAAVAGRRAGNGGSSGRRPAAGTGRRRGPRRCRWPARASRRRCRARAAARRSSRTTGGRRGRSAGPRPRRVSTCRSTPVRCADPVEHLQAVRRVADGRGHQRQQLLAALLLGLVARLLDRVEQRFLARLRSCPSSPICSASRSSQPVVVHRGRVRAGVGVDHQQVHGVRSDVQHSEPHGRASLPGGAQPHLRLGTAGGQ